LALGLHYKRAVLGSRRRPLDMKKVVKERLFEDKEDLQQV
jgi:hypothetical protein